MQWNVSAQKSNAAGWVGNFITKLNNSLEIGYPDFKLRAFFIMKLKFRYRRSYLDRMVSPFWVFFQMIQTNYS